MRVDLSTDQFGHFVVIRGFVEGGGTVVFNDSYPSGDYWNSSPQERRSAGELRTENWYDFDRSWASHVDVDDPLSPEGHVRWAMAVR